MDKIVIQPWAETNQEDNFVISNKIDGYSTNSNNLQSSPGYINTTSGIPLRVAPLIKNYISFNFNTLYSTSIDMAVRGQLVSDAALSTLKIDSKECNISLTTTNVEMSFVSQGDWSIGYFLLTDTENWHDGHFIPLKVGFSRGTETISKSFVIPKLTTNQIAVVAYSDYSSDKIDSIVPHGRGINSITTKIGYYGTTNI